MMKTTSQAPELEQDPFPVRMKNDHMRGAVRTQIQTPGEGGESASARSDILMNETADEIGAGKVAFRVCGVAHFRMPFAQPRGELGERFHDQTDRFIRRSEPAHEFGIVELGSSTTPLPTPTSTTRRWRCL